ncbi:MAG: alkaline phosphatase family protein, partial [Deltaproteobacteria bacterium]|nr:alkaline phosphatase family protein [Deltaproteobacteria bacterium]
MSFPLMKNMKKIFGSILLFLALFTAKPLYALNDVYVIHFVLDGARYDVLHKYVENGSLPNLKKHFLENGVVFDQALTTFPTVSSSGYASYITGLSAGNSGIFFLEWFDRESQKPIGYLTNSGAKRINDDMTNQPTLFERLSASPTAAVYTPYNRGAKIITPAKLPFRGIWNGLVAKNGAALNHLAMEEVHTLFA